MSWDQLCCFLLCLSWRNLKLPQVEMLSISETHSHESLTRSRLMCCWAPKTSETGTTGGGPQYLMHSSEHLGCVGDSFHGAAKDVQRQLQPLQDPAALTVQTQALQHLKTHIRALGERLIPFIHRSLVIHGTSRVSRPLVISRWTFSSARFRACSSACSLCFRVYWSQRKARAIWEKAVCQQKQHLLLCCSLLYIKQFALSGSNPLFYLKTSNLLNFAVVICDWRWTVPPNPPLTSPCCQAKSKEQLTKQSNASLKVKWKSRHGHELYAVLPVEAHPLYDGQLAPARGRRLLLTALCCKDSTSFRSPDRRLLHVWGNVILVLPSSLSSLATTVEGKQLLVSASGWKESGVTSAMSFYTQSV